MFRNMRRLGDISLIRHRGMFGQQLVFFRSVRPYVFAAKSYRRLVNAAQRGRRGHGVRHVTGICIYASMTSCPRRAKERRSMRRTAAPPRAPSQFVGESHTTESGRNPRSPRRRRPRGTASSRRCRDGRTERHRHQGRSCAGRRGAAGLPRPPSRRIPSPPPRQAVRGSPPSRGAPSRWRGRAARYTPQAARNRVGRGRFTARHAAPHAKRIGRDEPHPAQLPPHVVDGVAGRQGPGGLADSKMRIADAKPSARGRTGAIVSAGRERTSRSPAVTRSSSTRVSPPCRLIATA